MKKAEIQQKIWDLKDEGLSSGDIAKVVKMPLEEVNNLYVVPKPLSDAMRHYFHD